MLFVAAHESVPGTPRHFTAMHYFGRFRSEADMHWEAKPAKSVDLDPSVWSGRAVQEDFVDLADAVLHQCIRFSVSD
jgi:hypothetical protein